MNSDRDDAAVDQARADPGEKVEEPIDELALRRLVLRLVKNEQQTRKNPRCAISRHTELDDIPNGVDQQEILQIEIAYLQGQRDHERGKQCGREAEPEEVCLIAARANSARF